MRVVVATAITGLVLAALGAPVAAAGPTAVLPEVPYDPTRTVFADNPAIVDRQPRPAESWSRRGDGLAVNFTTGTPQCFGVHATAAETAETVSVDLQGGTPPEAVGRACIMIAVSGTLDVPLQSPLGDRQVLSSH